MAFQNNDVNKIFLIKERDLHNENYGCLSDTVGSDWPTAECRSPYVSATQAGDIQA